MVLDTSNSGVVLVDEVGVGDVVIDADVVGPAPGEHLLVTT